MLAKLSAIHITLKYQFLSGLYEPKHIQCHTAATDHIVWQIFNELRGKELAGL